MYLKSVTEYDGTQTQSKTPYVFSYYGRTVDNKDTLPNRVSYAQDHWGCYNGMDNNASLIPGYTGPFGTLDPQFDAFDIACSGVSSAQSFSDTYLIGDRCPSFPAMRAGTLQAIQ